MPIDGKWFVSEAPLTFMLQLEDDRVTGLFHDEKTFTCELKGRLSGNRLSFNFETVFSWLNEHDMGSATLVLSADGTTLAGPVLFGGKPVNWTLKRSRPAPQAVPPAAPPPQPIQFRPPPPRPGGGGGERMLPYHDRILKEIWDSDHDPALKARLIERAKHEPELKKEMQRKGKLPPD